MGTLALTRKPLPNVFLAIGSCFLVLFVCLFGFWLLCGGFEHIHTHTQLY